MTDLEQRLRGLGDQPVPQPTGVESLARRARRLRRRRRSLRATGAVLGLVLVTGAVLSVAGVLAPRPSIVFSPGNDSSQAGVPEGWQTVAVGAAALSVPADWPVTDVKVQGPIPHPEHIFRSGPAVYLADQLYQPPGPPAPDDAPARKPGVYALPAHGDPEHARWLADEGTRVTVNGQEAMWAATEEFRWYAFPALDLLLWVSYDPDPALMDEVLATVRRAEGAAVDDPAEDDQEGVVRADTPEGEAAMELVVDRGVLRSDEQIAFRLVNRGQLDLLTGAPFAVQRWDGQAWRTLPMDPIWKSYGFVFAPGEQSVEQRWPTDEALWTAPGWYRIVKSASYEVPEHLQPDPELQARTRFRVIGAPDPQPQQGTATRGDPQRSEQPPQPGRNAARRSESATSQPRPFAVVALPSGQSDHRRASRRVGPFPEKFVTHQGSDALYGAANRYWTPMNGAETFDDFCRGEWPRLVGTLALYCGDAAVAEEFAQEVPPRCKRTSNALPWR